MKKDYEMAKLLPLEERALVVKYAKRGVWLVNIWFLIVVLTSLLFLVKSFALMFYYYAMGETQLIEFYELTYPDAIEKVKFHVVPYVLLYALQCYIDVYNVVMYSGVVPLAPMFILHACGQLELLKIKVKQLISEGGSDQEKNYNLKIIVKQLQDIYRFVEDIQTGFKLLYELTLKGTAVMLPILAYEILETFDRGGVDLEFITLFGATFILSYCPCYYGDLLIEKAESFRTAVYMSGWEGVWDKRARTTILVIMTRTFRTVAIRTMFRNLCLDALTDVITFTFL
ncbi:uncharacterized protein LOC126369791 [Pectinophora gossypiella]|uniref:uncharacterized protein LOC126369791 n=1 Tax=Pectinophora gossypiella TaxID=13191 RepID=UPI00214F1826|nr:uncharacterized protein LOC126369791 [Pectinophora gossypiella]